LEKTNRNIQRIEYPSFVAVKQSGLSKKTSEPKIITSPIGGVQTGLTDDKFKG